MLSFTTVSIFILILATSLAYFPNRNNLRIGRLLNDYLFVILIVVIPLITFLLSSFIVPEWKGGAIWGALDLLLLTKLTLLPFVLWAIASLYTLEVVRPKNRDQYWIVLGLFSGAIISLILFTYVIALLATKEGIVKGVLFVLVFGPGYVPIWYTYRFWQQFKTSKLNKILYLYTAISQLPFWGYALYATKQQYLLLPDKQPQCFVTTASAQGFRCIVGDPIIYNHKGSHTYASKQMIRFWTFENLWTKTHPYTHAKFRNIYNILGKKLAKKINTPFKASLSFIILKPIEWIILSVLVVNYFITNIKKRLNNHH